jgi:hypothetical protein
MWGRSGLPPLNEPCEKLQSTFLDSRVEIQLQLSYIQSLASQQPDKDKGILCCQFSLKAHLSTLQSEAWQSYVNWMCIMMSSLSRLTQQGYRTGASRDAGCWALVLCPSTRVVQSFWTWLLMAFHYTAPTTFPTYHMLPQRHSPRSHT